MGNKSCYQYFDDPHKFDCTKNLLNEYVETLLELYKWDQDIVSGKLEEVSKNITDYCDLIILTYNIIYYKNYHMNFKILENVQKLVNGCIYYKESQDKNLEDIMREFFPLKKEEV